MKKNLRGVHTFVVCAYKESPYLRECIQSLLNQSSISDIIIATSTPNEHISGIAKEFDIPVYVNTGESGITQDWNFGLSCAKTQFVTIAHQDDLYFEHYARAVVGRLKAVSDSQICFTDYCERRGDDYEDANTLLFIKRLLLLPIRFPGAKNRRFAKRLILSIGSSICCPSVTFNMANIEGPVFENGLKSNGDWQAWERLLNQAGSFVYCPYVLMSHRIHEGSETSAIINSGRRSDEDLVMFRKFWCEPIARGLAKVYSLGEKSNSVEK